jgi:hypothetical protein
VTDLEPSFLLSDEILQKVLVPVHVLVVGNRLLEEASQYSFVREMFGIRDQAGPGIDNLLTDSSSYPRFLKLTAFRDC